MLAQLALLEWSAVVVGGCQGCPHGAPLTSSAVEASSAAWWRRASSRKSEIMALAAWFGMREPCGSTAPVLGDLCENQNFTARSR